MDRHLPKENTQMANKYMKTHSTSFVIRKLQIKTQMVYLLEWLKFLKLTVPTAGKDMEQQEISFIAGGNAKWYSHFGRQYGSFIQS